MITIESITEKLGFNPLRHEYVTVDHEDDNWEDPFKDLTIEEIRFIAKMASEDATCRASFRQKE